MPMGPGTYGSKRGRPPMKNKMTRNAEKKAMQMKKMMAQSMRKTKNNNAKKK